MALGNRVKEIREQRQLTQASLAEKIGISQQAIHMLEQRDSRSSKFLVEIANALDVDAEWLVHGNKDISVEKIKNIQLTTKPNNSTRLVPIIGFAQLGDGGYWEPIEYPVGHGDGYIYWYSNDPEVYAVQGVGDSMSPRIRHHEFIIIEPNKKISNGDEVFVVTTNDRRMVKIFSYLRDGRVHLESINNDHEKIILSSEDILKMHYVAGIAKSKAEI